MILQFTVVGKPVGKARPRVTRNGTYVPKTTKNYMRLVRDRYAKAYFFEGPVCMEVYAYFPIPKSASKKEREKIAAEGYLYTKKPDGDNVLKSIKDALSGEAYYDDSQVAYEMILRKYAEDGTEPRVDVVLYDQKGGRMNAE